MESKRLGKGFECNGIWNLTPRETFSCCREGAVLIDVREEYMNRFKMFDVPEVIYCPNSMLAEVYPDLPADKPMIFADAAGIHSKEAVTFLIGKGLGGRVANMAGGLVEWERDGLPLIIDKSERLSGSCMCQLHPRENE
ncbi:MAG: rhodanese-like domain-containing protein [Bacteroidales bacterium]|nr:rhodanese-like domain-containing protein [Bacteroidales bacterium]